MTNAINIPNAGLMRGYAVEVAGRHACDVELCTRTATHCLDPKGYVTFIPFMKGQRSVAGPMVCEIDAIMIDAEYRVFGTRFDDRAPNSDPKAPRWESTVTLKRSRA